MIQIAYGLAVLLFYVTFKKLDVIGRTRDLLAIFRSATGVMSDKALSDREKETRIRAEAIRSGGATIGLVLRLLAVLLAAAVPVVIAIYAGMISLDAFIAFSLNPLVLVGTVIVLVAFEKLWQRRPG